MDSGKKAGQAKTNENEQNTNEQYNVFSGNQTEALHCSEVLCARAGNHRWNFAKKVILFQKKFSADLGLFFRVDFANPRLPASAV